MSIPRVVRSAAIAAAIVGASAAGAAALTPISVGAIVGYSSEHLPTYVALERGFFAKEGLDATLLPLSARALTVGGLSGQIDFIPLPTAAALAALHGSPIAFVAGETVRAQWVVVADKDITKIADLRGKTLALGEPGSAAYDEGARLLSHYFHMEPGKDYKVISFQVTSGEISALINGDVQAAFLTTSDSVHAEKAGFKILLGTGSYMPRLGGELWTLRPFVDQHPDTVKAFIRAIAEAIMYIRTNEAGTLPILKKYLGMDDPQDQALLWDQIHDGYEATMDPALFRDIFEARRAEMISMGQWDKTKPLPDVETFVARKLLDQALQEVHYVPLKIKAEK